MNTNSASDASWEEYTKNDPDDNIFGSSDSLYPLLQSFVDFKFNTTQSYMVVFRKDYDVGIGNKDNYYVYLAPSDRVEHVCDIYAN